jgi:hypothetical protein
MQIVKSNKFTKEESDQIDRIISSIFKSNNQDVSKFEPNRSFFISNDPLENPDFVINIHEFTNPQPLARERMFQLFHLSKSIFGSVIEPRILLSNYDEETKNEFIEVKQEPIAVQQQEQISLINKPSEDIIKETSFKEINF